MGQPYIKEALAEINNNREKQQIISKQNKELFYVDHPEIRDIDREISQIFSNALKKTLDGHLVDFEIIKKDSLEMQMKRKEMLESLGIKESFFEPKFACKKCSDTGYSNGFICECVKNLATKKLYEELNKDIPLSESTFSNFNLEYYPNSSRTLMTKICDYCVRYANEFSMDSPSLFFTGKTGLGKTHLSLAIANEVITKGFEVVYGPLSRIIGKIEKEKFSSDSDNITLNKITECDLLILDDLGTEFSTAFVVSAIYDIINMRMLNKKPTIISTNLSIQELENKYSPRIVSRISSSYRMFEFLGEDIRSIK